LIEERRTDVGTTATTQDGTAERREPALNAAPQPRATRERTASRAGEEQTGRKAGKRRRSPKDGEGASTIRYFLTKLTANGTPELDQEMPDEHAALVAALKADRSFVTVEEWKARPDSRNGVTVIVKEPVVRSSIS
jgi:hypothetical protein